MRKAASRAGELRHREKLSYQASGRMPNQMTSVWGLGLRRSGSKCLLRLMQRTRLSIICPILPLLYPDSRTATATIIAVNLSSKGTLSRIAVPALGREEPRTVKSNLRQAVR